MTQTMILTSLQRTSSTVAPEILHFQPGVNVITGEPNSGKTKWLQMLDYALGDTGEPENAFGEELADKYETISLTVDIGDKQHHIERRWKEPGKKTKMLVNEDWINASDFSEYILKELEIPQLHFPKGNPFAERAWPELSWRMLLRHIYRQERFWSDFADKQPEIEQHAVLTQFLGVAEKLFPQELGNVVQQRKTLYRLQARKEQYQELLDEISSQILSASGDAIVVTLDTLEDKIREWQQELEALDATRTKLLAGINTRSGDRDSTYSDIGIARRRVDLASELNEVSTRLRELERRQDELTLYRNSVNQELSRLRRAQVSSTVLADLKITHCPACDQELQNRVPEPGHCYLCGQTVNDMPIQDRFQFEINQLDEEVKELDALLSKAIEEKKQLESRRAELHENLIFLDNELRPAQQNLLALMPSELPALDTQRGRVEERIIGAERLKRLLGKRNELSSEIDRLEQEIGKLDAALEEKGGEANFESSADALTDGMNTYTNRIHAGHPNRWGQQRISLKLKERSFEYMVGPDKRTTLGATFTYVLFLSYHFGLMNLSSQPMRHYPGLCVIDFPPRLSDEVGEDKRLAYLIEPFVTLLNKPDMLGCQLVVAGKGFSGMDNINEIQMPLPWK